MENENEQAHDVQEQEDTSAVDTGSDQDFGSDEETITIAKSKFKSLRYKAAAYDNTKDKPQPTINKSSDEKWKQKMELKVDGYTDQEAEFILKNGGKKALEENSFIKAGIEATRQQKLAEAAMLSNEGQKSSQQGGLNPSDFAKLSADEQLKTLSKLN